MHELKAVIFDLGGVIIDLHEERTIAYFSKWSGLAPDHVRAVIRLSVFQQFEKGLISERIFRDAVRDHLNINVSDEQLDTGWNAMLGEIPIARLDLLRSLKRKRRVFLLSNTNSIHLRAFSNMARRTAGNVAFEHFFDHAYYSHEISMRKPDREVFEWVLLQNRLRAAETLFLDDNLENIHGAHNVGMQTMHVTHPDLIFSLFHEDQR